VEGTAHESMGNPASVNHAGLFTPANFGVILGAMFSF
jgi:hypothetical protein